jgi:hypothetical protein
VSYYYLAAQLPYLIYGQGVPMSSGAFRELAASALSGEDARILAYCTLDPDPQPAGLGLSYREASPPSGNDFLDQWHAWERSLRLNLGRLRFQRVKREGGAPADPPPDPADAAAAAKAAGGIESPLEAEIFLDKCRWNAIETFQGIQYFSRNTIYAYLLKLLLMERRLKFKTEEGFTEYKGLYSAVMTAASDAESRQKSGVSK